MTPLTKEERSIRTLLERAIKAEARAEAAEQRMKDMEYGLRHIMRTADTLSPQEFINVCANALGVRPIPKYAGECAPNTSIYELRGMLQRAEKRLDQAAS